MKKAPAWSTCVIQGIRLEVGMGSGKQPVVVRARIGRRWWKVIAMSPLELIVGAQSEITAAAGRRLGSHPRAVDQGLPGFGRPHRGRRPRPGTGTSRRRGSSTPFGRLRSLGFIDYPSPGLVVAKPVLFLEGA